MLILKGFFRKKSTKIYLTIYSILFITIFSMIILIKYCDIVMNAIYKEKSYITLTSKGDYFEQISKLNGVEKVERIIIFEENEKDTTFQNQSYSVISKDTKINYDNEEKYEEIVCWEDYGVSSLNSATKIIIKPDKNNELNLKDNEIVLSSEGVKNKKQKTKDSLKGKNIIFKYNGNEVEFRIKDYYDSNDLEMMISENKFNELNLNSYNYSYKIYINNYLDTEETENQLKNATNYNDLEIETRINYYGTENANKVTNSIEFSSIFEMIIFFSIIGFIIIFIIVTGNILSDEKKNSRIERILGFNKNQVKLHVILKIITLLIVAIVISTIISTILGIIIL